MDDTSVRDRNDRTSSFVDDELDFDLGLIGEDPTVERTGRFSLPRRSGPYKPLRVRNTPNWGRIAAAIVVLATFVFVVAFAVNAYRDHRKDVAYRAYFTSVKDVADRSTAMGQALGDLTSQSTGIDRAQVIGQVDKLAKQSKDILDDARAIEPPTAIRGAHVWLVMTMEYRRNGLVSLKQSMTRALQGTDIKSAAALVVASNRRLDASDVIYVDSFMAAARTTLAREQVRGVTVPPSVFVTDPEFTSPRAVALTIKRLASGAKVGKGASKAATPGLHGNGLGTVSVNPGGVALQSGTPVEVQGSDNLEFGVEVQNQGAGQETQVPVTITLKGVDSEPQKLQATLDRIDPGSKVTVKVPMTSVPTFGVQQDVCVTIGAVPGEKNTANNTACYQVLFKL